MLFIPNFNRLEKMILNAVQEALSDDTGTIFRLQLNAVTKVVRHDNGRDVYTYPMVWWKVRHDPLLRFPNQQVEAKLATVHFRTSRREPNRIAVISMVRGYFFSIRFDKSPKDIRIYDSLQLVSVTLGSNPMTPFFEERKGSSQYASISLSGWLADWQKKFPVTGTRVPQDEQHINSRLYSLSVDVPPDYLTMLCQTDGFDLREFSVFGINDLYELEIENIKYVALASVNGDGVIGWNGKHPNARGFYLAYDGTSPVAIGTSLEEALIYMCETRPR